MTTNGVKKLDYKEEDWKKILNKIFETVCITVWQSNSGFNNLYKKDEVEKLRSAIKQVVGTNEWSQSSLVGKLTIN